MGELRSKVRLWVMQFALLCFLSSISTGCWQSQESQFSCTDLAHANILPKACDRWASSAARFSELCPESCRCCAQGDSCVCNDNAAVHQLASKFGVAWIDSCDEVLRYVSCENQFLSGYLKQLCPCACKVPQPTPEPSAAPSAEPPLPSEQPPPPSEQPPAPSQPASPSTAPSPVEAFPQGVAAGDPEPDSIVLWTRFNPNALTSEQLSVTLNVDISTTQDFQAPSTYSAETTADSDYTIHIPVAPLSPATRYFYRFRALGYTSTVGTFRTAPDRATSVPVKFGYTGDSDIYSNSSFFVLDRLREENPDFWFYLGDTIYADSIPQALQGVPKATTVDDYRNRYKQNRQVPALQNIYNSLATVVLWDDHEVRNDFTSQSDAGLITAGAQAFYEYQPVGTATGLSDSSCAATPKFRVLHYGADVDFFVLDERSCRSASAESSCIETSLNNSPFAYFFPTLPTNVLNAYRASAAANGVASQLIDMMFPTDVNPSCIAAINDPTRTMLGPVQKQAFKDALLASTAAVKVIVSEVPIMQVFLSPYDRWEGYAAERNELIRFIRDNVRGKILFATTDSHATYLNGVRVDLYSSDAADRQSIGYEMVTGPIATMTFQEEITFAATMYGLTSYAGLLQSIAHSTYSAGGVICRNFHQKSYASVIISGESITISSKDDFGNVVTNADPTSPTSHQSCAISY